MKNQMSIFETIYPKYKITKPIRLIEFFAGYGSQALALKYLGNVKVEIKKDLSLKTRMIFVYN